MTRIEFKQTAMIEIAKVIIGNEKILQKIILQADAEKKDPAYVAALFAEKYASALIARFENLRDEK